MSVDPRDRVAAHHTGPLTLINSFDVPEGRDDDFLRLWAETSAHFRSQPGYLSLRLHRAIGPNGPRFVNVARWASMAEFQAAHQHADFARLIGRPEWREFPSRPGVYEEIRADG